MPTFIDELGGPSVVARMLGIKLPSVLGWKGRVPKERCPAIERCTNGRFTVEKLRDDVTWLRVPDPTWPHPGGRPCIDVAASVMNGAPAKAACSAAPVPADDPAPSEQVSHG